MATQIKQIERRVDPEMVEMLENVLADVKAGRLTDVVIVGNHIADGGFFRSAVFADRWRLLGALEYAKDGINRC